MTPEENAGPSSGNRARRLTRASAAVPSSGGQSTEVVQRCRKRKNEEGQSRDPGPRKKRAQEETAFTGKSIAEGMLSIAGSQEIPVDAASAQLAFCMDQDQTEVLPDYIASHVKAYEDDALAQASCLPFAEATLPLLATGAMVEDASWAGRRQIPPGMSAVRRALEGRQFDNDDMREAAGRDAAGLDRRLAHLRAVTERRGDQVQQVMESGERAVFQVEIQPGQHGFLVVVRGGEAEILQVFANDYHAAQSLNEPRVVSEPAVARQHLGDIFAEDADSASAAQQALFGGAVDGELPAVNIGFRRAELAPDRVIEARVAARMASNKAVWDGASRG